MSLSQRLDQRQSQTLVMTPQLQQAIKLLQMSNMELGDFVEQEIEKNPLLERGDSVPTQDGNHEANTENFTPSGDTTTASPTDNHEFLAANIHLQDTYCNQS